ncbi:MAG TPA: hypothetical protein VM802_23430 [Chitinophaga sp.]|uniref:hypothetical protein n=1 Tax=Chitinophaga sp. TaxID=1869181 RepID=UPI002CF66DF1|nr:hypothetical protein [Chitinophaga sp.]HVI47841.1 hypothetical protein [Chitinophaga sp.]
MAKQISIITFTGRLGNLIGYRRRNEYFLRSMPVNVRQTVATRRAAQRFGMASKKAALIRHAFSGQLDVRCDTSHINRLTSALIPSAGHDISGLTGFRFNRYTGTEKFLTSAPGISRNGILYIPPQTLHACKGISLLEIKVIATRINFTTHQVTGTESTVLTVKTGDNFEGAACDVDIPGTGTLVVTLQIRGIPDNIPSCNKMYLAADIIAVLPSQPPSQVLHRPIRRQRARLKPASGKVLTPASPLLLLPIIQRE